MSKGQRGNKEVKKQKKDPAKAAAPSATTPIAVAPAPERGKKK